MKGLQIFERDLGYLSDTICIRNPMLIVHLHLGEKFMANIDHTIRTLTKDELHMYGKYIHPNSSNIEPRYRLCKTYRKVCGEKILICWMKFSRTLDPKVSSQCNTSSVVKYNILLFISSYLFLYLFNDSYPILTCFHKNQIVQKSQWREMILICG